MKIIISLLNVLKKTHTSPYVITSLLYDSVSRASQTHNKAIARTGLEVKIDFHGMSVTIDRVNETPDVPKEYLELFEPPNKMKSRFMLRNE